MALRLALKEDLADALRRWDAFWAGEVLDRPPVRIYGQKGPGVPGPSYHDRCHLPIGDLVRKAVASVENTECWGEAMPYVRPELGPDQVGAWFGGELEFSAASMSTNWIHPFVTDWNAAWNAPLRITWAWSPQCSTRWLCKMPWRE